MTRFSIRTLSKAAAWIAAYAFVLNTLLATVILSSIPAQALSGAEAYCGSMQGPSPVDQTGDKGKGEVRHLACVICVSTSHAPVLPDSSSLRIERAGITSLQRTDVTSVAPSDERHTPRLSQGPPTSV